MKAVDGFTVGDEVYGCAGGFKGHGGALAEMMTADARLLAHKPRSLDFAEAAALPLVAITAWEALVDMANVQATDYVLIHGGAGGVGHIAIQLAKARGARVATTISSATKAGLVRRYDVDGIINYRQEPVRSYVDRLTEGRGFDIVFDTIGGDVLGQSFAAARKGGQIINILPFGDHDLTPAWASRLTVHFENMAIPLLTGAGRVHHGHILRQIAGLVDDGKMKPLVDPNRFTISQANEAHAFFESRRHVGKIVLLADQSTA